MITAGGDHPPVASDRPVHPGPDGAEIRVRAVAEWSFVDEVTAFGPPR